MKPNYRWIKREGKIFTTTDKRELCDDCVKQPGCPVQKSMAKIMRCDRAATKVVACEKFQFALTFRSKEGLDWPQFNTMRLGPAWSKRLREGDIVLLTDTDGNPYGEARVSWVKFGSIEDMVMRYAADNHLYLNSELNGEKAGLDLLKKLPGLYGNLIYQNNRHNGMTVICLSPVPS